MNTLLVVVQLLLMAAMVIYLIVLGFSILATRLRMRRLGKKLRKLGVSSRELTPSELAACTAVFPRHTARLRTGNPVLTVTGHYGYTLIRDRNGNEYRSNHALGSIPLVWDESMRPHVDSDEEVRADLVLLRSGTALVISINDSWTVKGEADARAIIGGTRGAELEADGWKIQDLVRPLSPVEIRHRYPLLRPFSALLLLIGMVLPLVWESSLPLIPFAGTSAVFLLAGLLLLFRPDKIRGKRGVHPVKLTGPLSINREKGTVRIDRFFLDIPETWKEGLEEGKSISAEGWVHPKLNTLFVAVALHDYFGGMHRSVIEEKGGRWPWTHLIIAAIAVFLPLFFSTVSVDPLEMAREYLAWKQYGQEVRQYDSIETLAGELEAGTLRFGMVFSFTGMTVLPGGNGSDSEAYRLIASYPPLYPDFSSVRRKAENLTRFIRTPVSTALFAQSFYSYSDAIISTLMLPKLASDETVESFQTVYSDSSDFSAFAEVWEQFQKDDNNTSLDQLHESWESFLDTETREINEAFHQSIEEALEERPSVPVSVTYYNPWVGYPHAGRLFKPASFSPYKVPRVISGRFFSSPEEWLHTSMPYEYVLQEAEELYERLDAAGMTNADTDLFAHMQYKAFTENGRTVLPLEFSLYRLEAIEKKEPFIIMYFVLTAVLATILTALFTVIIRNFIYGRRRRLNTSGLYHN